MDLATKIQLVSALTALAAVIIGPLVSLYIARRQITASVVSTNRHIWIQEIRALLSEFVVELRLSDIGMSKGGIRFENEKELVDSAGRCTKLATKIKLMLNPNELAHIKLEKMVDEAIQLVGSNSKAARALVEKTDDIVQFSKQLLKIEWDRVKNGK